MLIFLRKIRKSLIDSLPAGKAGGSTKKYLLYAFGEIALVVIGILIALQINNWNEWRKERNLEQKTLIAIAANIETNVEFIKANLERRDLIGLSSSQIIMDAIDQKRPWHDSLAIHFDNAFRSRVPTLSFSAYETLKTRGIDIIRSDTLQNAIVDLYDSHYQDMQTVLTRIVHTELKPSMTPFVTAHFERKLSGRGLIPNDYESLINNQKTKNHITYIQRYRMTAFKILQSRSLEQSEIVLELIKEELGERDL